MPFGVHAQYFARFLGRRKQVCTLKINRPFTIARSYSAIQAHAFYPIHITIRLQLTPCCWQIRVQGKATHNNTHTFDRPPYRGHCLRLLILLSNIFPYNLLEEDNLFTKDKMQKKVAIILLLCSTIYYQYKGQCDYPPCSHNKHTESLHASNSHNERKLLLQKSKAL